MKKKEIKRIKVKKKSKITQVRVFCSIIVCGLQRVYTLIMIIRTNYIEADLKLI